MRARPHSGHLVLVMHGGACGACAALPATTDATADAAPDDGTHDADSDNQHYQEHPPKLLDYCHCAHKVYMGASK